MIIYISLQFCEEPIKENVLPKGSRVLTGLKIWGGDVLIVRNHYIWKTVMQYGFTEYFLKS